MTSILFSRDWYRLAHLKPTLRRHVEVHVHNYRGDRWYVLQNHSTGQFRRIHPQAYLLVGLMDGVRTIEQIWELASDRLGDDLPSHEEILQLVGSLYQANLIRMDLSGDAAELFRHGNEQRRKRWMGKLRSPLSVQIPVFDPNDFLTKTQHWVKPFFTKIFLFIWLAMIIMLAVLAVRHWGELTNNVGDQLLAADNILLLWFIYPVIKLLHELGHGYVIKRAGGSVHEVGIMLLVFFPMPYVDASASTGFASKYQRMLVDGAGMMVELFIAAIAMVVWINAEQGFVHSIAYNILFIAGLSTLLFNGNPLLRFDGYYLLADWLEMPNLAQKSNQHWAYLSKRFLFALPDQESPANDVKEAFIYAIYGAASLFYRLFISVTIVLFVAQQYFIVGIVLAIWSVVMVWIWPFGKTIWETLKNPEIKQRGRNPQIVVGLLAVFIYSVLFVLPVPKTTTIEGVVQANEASRLTISENCFFVRWRVQPGEQVSKSDPVLDCENKSLFTELAMAQQQYSEVVAQRRSVFADPVQLKVLEEELKQLTQSISELETRSEQLTLSAGIDGMLMLPHYSDQQGQWLRRGQVVGYIAAAEQFTVNAMLPEHKVEQVRSDARQMIIRGSSNIRRAFEQSQWSVFPSSSRELPSPVLSTQGGGVIAMDPTLENQTIENYFPVEIAIADIPLDYINERVYVQFVHQPEAIGFRVYRTVRRTFLKYFDV
jgi:putative peptide zinc metalloprotease protein